MRPYNLGVICAGAAIGFMAYARFGSKIRDWLTPYFGIWSSGVWFLAAIILMWTWIYDSCWLFYASKKKFAEWLEELEDKRDPTPDPGFLMRGFYGLRRLLHG